jgi:hypothetical protein
VRFAEKRSLAPFPHPSVAAKDIYEYCGHVVWS